jgi:hypothetical protein
MQRRTVSAQYLLGVLLDRFLHPQRRVAGTHRVVLVGDGRAEQRHNAVAHDLIDGPLVAVDGVHHPAEHGVQDAASIFGIAVGEQLHRAFEIGEEDGHLLALAFESRAGGEDALGKMLGSVGVRRGLRRCHRDGRGGCGSDASAALVAEAAARGVLVATRGTGGVQLGTALVAELGTVAVLVLALRALHRRPSHGPVADRAG